MTALEKRLLSLQQKVEQLNSEVLTLIDLTTLEHSRTVNSEPAEIINQEIDNPSASTRKSQIGINRYKIDFRQQ